MIGGIFLGLLAIVVAFALGYAALVVAMMHTVRREPTRMPDRETA